jgi:DEAD/DEAH box helicase domain-containing protein
MMPSEARPLVPKRFEKITANGLFHCTTVDCYRAIRADGAIKPNLGDRPHHQGATVASRAFRLKMISLFDQATSPSVSWLKRWLTIHKPITIGIELNREALRGQLVSYEETGKLSTGLMLRGEVCCRGEIPTECITGFLLVPAAHPSLFKRVAGNVLTDEAIKNFEDEVARITQTGHHHTRMPQNLVYLDLEIQRTAEEAGGWKNLHKLGISVAVALSANQLHIFTANEVKELAAFLKAADCVVGYNIRDFDLKVLGGYRGVKTDGIKYLDLMWEIADITGFRIPLASLRAATLGTTPQTDGLELIKLWKKGKIEKVIEGCCNDVLAIGQLHEYGVAHGELFYFKGDSKQRKKIKVDWSSPKRTPR